MAARRLIEEWRIDYNARRPHTSLGGLTPNEFATQSGDVREVKDGVFPEDEHSYTVQADVVENFRDMIGRRRQL